MKKTLVALTVAAIAASSANAATLFNQNGSKLDVTGSARVMLVNTTGSRTDLQNDGSRINFKFSQKISDDLSALGHIEIRPSGNDFKGDIKTKYVYAGLKSQSVGELSFGKRKTAGDNFLLADPSEQFTNIKGGLDIFDKGSKVINFASADFLGFGLQGSYMFADNGARSVPVINSTTDKPLKDANGNVITTRNGDANGWQTLLTYNADISDNVNIQANTYYSVKKQNNTLDKSNTTSHQVWGVSGAINFFGAGLAVDYAQARQNGHRQWSYDNNPAYPSTAGKAHGIQVAATYQLTDPMDIYTAYHSFTYGEAQGAGTGSAHVRGVVVGSHYQINKNVLTYIEYDTDKGNNGARRNNSYYAGLRVFF